MVILATKWKPIHRTVELIEAVLDVEMSNFWSCLYTIYQCFQKKFMKTLHKLFKKVFTKKQS